MSKPIDCVITTLAPVHLGADEVYEPLGFVIDEVSQRLVAFEPWSFLEKLPERDRHEFARLCQKGTVSSLLEIYRFFHERRRLAQGRLVDVCPGLVKHYQDMLKTTGRDLDIQKALNQFTISRTAFLAADQRPYIPGSAVKGALRTAYLNVLAQMHTFTTPKDQKGRWDPRTLEHRLLNYQKIDEDPFRLLKVSDFRPVGEVRTRIVYAVNEKKKPSPKFPEARGPYQILEVIEAGAKFCGTITVEELPPEVRGLAKIKSFLDKNGLWRSARAFYNHEKEREERELYELGIKALLPEIEADCFPLRLGRHSGAECVTIAGHRKIRIMLGQRQSKELDHATTLWLAADYHQRDKRLSANLRPMGWAALGELTDEAVRKLTSREDVWRRESRPLAVVSAMPEAGEAAPARPDELAPAPSGPSPKLMELLDRLKATKPNDAGRVGAFFDGLQELTDPEEKSALAGAVLQHFDRKVLKRQKRWKELEPYVAKG